MGPREKELIGKVFKDENGIPYQGQRFIQVVNLDTITGFMDTEMNYLNGKAHGNPAIIYPDGLEEQWENGSFIKTTHLPNAER